MGILIENLTHVYSPNSPFESTAITDISFEVKDGEFLGLIGHTGSGKSTLVQHLNGLLLPTKGRITVDGVELKKGVNMKEIRQKVGLVFQYPEHQLFEETVALDVGFGPKNLGLPQEKIEERVKEALEMVNLSYEEYKDRSPFELSGGQMRRVALAGVLAMRPKILVLDEPTAGLDPRGRDEILDQVSLLHKKYGITVVLVSHSMEDIARLVDRLIVLSKGKIILEGTPREVFQHRRILEEAGLGIPQITKMMQLLKEKGKKVRTDVLLVEEAEKEILEIMGRKRNA
jgi:energy-coupling factor transport system ATP-binding protein